MKVAVNSQTLSPPSTSLQSPIGALRVQGFRFFFAFFHVINSSFFASILISNAIFRNFANILLDIFSIIFFNNKKWNSDFLHKIIKIRKPFQYNFAKLFGIRQKWLVVMPDLAPPPLMGQPAQ